MLLRNITDFIRNTKTESKERIMGYQCDFFLGEFRRIGLFTDISKEEKADMIKNASEPLKSILRGEWYSGTWYNSEAKNDLEAFTKKYRDILIVLECNGEEQGDLFKIYAMNGDFQVCYSQIVYDDPPKWANV